MKKDENKNTRKSNATNENDINLKKQTIPKQSADN